MSNRKKTPEEIRELFTINGKILDKSYFANLLERTKEAVANNVDNKSTLDVACQICAEMSNGKKTPEEIRDFFDMMKRNLKATHYKSPFDLTSEEIRKKFNTEKKFFGGASLRHKKRTENRARKIAEKASKGKTPEQIRKKFNIKNDFTPEEEEKVLRENQSK